MIKNIKISVFVLLAAVLGLGACTKTEYSFGDITTPSDLTLTLNVAGVSTANPNGDGTGAVQITATATNALSYKLDFGDGTVQMLPSGTINYKFKTPGVNEYTVTVNAIGTAGTTSTLSKKVKVFVAFVIPDNIMSGLTGGTSKVWIVDKAAKGHFGVGPSGGPVGEAFTPFWYSADPNSREACAYDNEITFTKAGSGITMSVAAKGESFSIGAATAFYGFAGGDGCYAIDPGAVKNLAFSNSSSGSTSAVSTQIQFDVPGTGIMAFGTGGKSYEIISISDTKLQIRNIGADGNAWYQKFIVK